MTSGVSTIGLQLVSINCLKKGQTRLSTLNEQLSSGKEYSKLAEYTASEVKKMLNLSCMITQKESYISNIDTINTRVEVYNSSLTSIEGVAAEAITTIISSTTYDASKIETLSTEFKGYMSQMEYYLNQSVSGRYIYAGSRYNTVPVKDISTLPVPPTELGPCPTTELPAYDVDYGTVDPVVIASAYAKDTVAIDTEQDLQYGVTSTQSGFQNIILGLRWAYAATQDATNYKTYMERANSLITTGMEEVRAIHAGVAGDASALEKTKEQHEGLISNLQSQIDDIQSTDVNEVAVKLTTYQATLESAYAATAQMINLSLLHYL